MALTFGVGCLLGFLPFLVAPLDSLTYLIPLSLRDMLKSMTALLGGFMALTAFRGEPLGRYRRKFLQTLAFGAPAGLILLVIFQWQFIVRFPIHSGMIASEVVVAAPRLASCPCDVAASDASCLYENLRLAPAAMDRCWQGSRRLWNRLAWSFGYLLLVGGAQSFFGLLLDSSRRAPSLFLSYSRLDQDLAKRLVVDLRAHGFRVWLDYWEIEVGDPFQPKIKKAISRSTWFGIILSPDAVASSWVQAELDMALTREKKGGLTILPILHRPCEPPSSLREKHWADFTSSYLEGLNSLLRSLRSQRDADGHTLDA